jgi:hypothetical protein
MSLEEQSKHLTAFTVLGTGQLELAICSIRFLGCPALFPRLVEMALKGLIDVIVYINDILLQSRNDFEHREQLEKIFIRLRNLGLKVNLAKCEFSATNGSYLGYRLTPDIIFQGSDKLSTLRDIKALS